MPKKPPLPQTIATNEFKNLESPLRLFGGEGQGEGRIKHDAAPHPNPLDGTFLGNRLAVNRRSRFARVAYIIPPSAMRSFS